MKVRLHWPFRSIWFNPWYLVGFVLFMLSGYRSSRKYDSSLLFWFLVFRVVFLFGNIHLPKNTPEYRRIPKNTPEYRKIPKNTPEYPRIPFEFPRIPQNTNNIKILKDFGFLIFFYSVDGNISQKAMMIELLFVLLNYWSLVLFSFIFFIIIFVKGALSAKFVNLCCP